MAKTRTREKFKDELEGYVEVAKAELEQAEGFVVIARTRLDEALRAMNFALERPKDWVEPGD